MTHKFVIELTDEVKGYEDGIDYLERIYGAEEITDNEIYNQALEDFGKRLLQVLSQTTLKEDGYNVDSLVRQVANKLKKSGKKERA